MLAAVTPGWRLPSRAATVSAPAAVAAFPQTTPTTTDPPASTPREPPAAPTPPLWPFALTMIWLVGATLLLVRLAWGALAAARLTRRCLQLGNAEALSELRGLCAAAGVRDPVVLRQGDGVPVPMTFGWLRPVILLPADSAEWSPGRREAALRHELAHIRRRDWLWHTLAALDCALYWPNPLVWLAARRLRAESERACDDAVLASGARPSEYAGHLLEIARLLASNHGQVPGAAVAMAQRPHVESRLRAILAAGLDRRGLTRRRILGTMGAALLLLTPLAALRLAAQDNAADHARAAATRITSESNLRQIALGIIVYAQQHNGHLPDADQWTDEITPFWAKDMILPQLLHDPIVPGHRPSDYAFNKALSGKDINAIKDPSHTVLLFESTTGRRNAADTGQSVPTPGRHEGGTVYAFADGRVHWVPDGQPQRFGADLASAPILPTYLLHDHPGTGSFTGRVRYADGSPAAGMRVGAQIQNAVLSVLFEAERGVFVRNGIETPLPASVPEVSEDQMRRLSWADAITGPDGSYRLSGLSDLPYNIAILPLDLVHGDNDQSPWVAAAIEGATGQEGKAVTLPDLVLTHGGLITGTVTDAQGKPVAGVSVGSYGPERPASSAMIISSQTDAAGHYQLRVAPGTSRVYIADDHWKAADAVRVVAEGETKTGDFSVSPASPE